MTISEILPTLKALNRQDKIRAIEFLTHEVAKEESTFVDDQEHEFISQTDAFEASQILLKLLDEHRINAVS